MFNALSAMVGSMKTLFFVFLFGGMMSACSHLSAAPVAAEKPVVLEKHGYKRIDPYFWLKERENPEVINYLNAENAYADKTLAPVSELTDKLFAEMRSRIKEDESSAPFKDGAYYYYARFETGKEYPIYARKKGSLKAAEEILINVNELAEGQEYFSVPFPKVSPDGTKLIYAADSTGRRFYDLFVKDLKSKKTEKLVTDASGQVAWAADNRTIFYTKQHPETLRYQWAYRRAINGGTDELVYEEKDETYGLSVGKSRTNDYIFLISESTVAHEWRFLDSRQPNDQFEVFLPRERGHEYAVEDGVDGFYVVTNWQAKNFRLMKAPRRASKKEEWTEVIPHRDDILLSGVNFFRSHFAVEERRDGLSRLRVVERSSGKSVDVNFPDPTFVVSLSSNEEYDAKAVRYSYESLNRPDGTYDFDFKTGLSQLVKQRSVPNFDDSQYVSERVWAKVRDGTLVPISLVHKKGLKKDGKAPLFQYAYGSYGFSMDPSFSSEIFSLIDRGFVYAIAHIRGGSEMGRYWYEDGKLLKKRNTFTDFIDVTEHLIKEKFADPARVYGQGGSAGGLLIGAVANLRPDLYRGLHAAVPFVDVLTTMLDDSIPLTTGEYDEWGNPNDKEYYEYMASYSPYDNVEKKAYPHMLITSGLHDSQVQYWEPTKWAAKLRKYKNNDALILLRTEMDAGHGGASGRFEALKQTAEEYSFFLMLDGQK